MAINGNAGGGRVKKSVVPVVKLKKRDQNKMDLLTLKFLFMETGGMHGVLWSEIGDWANREDLEDELKPYRIDYEDGFGDTR